MTESNDSSEQTRKMNHAKPDGPAIASEQLAMMPSHLGNYKLSGVLGYGGMGVVYSAVQSHPQRDVAIKVLRLEFMEERRLQQFALEGELLGRLQHPYIAKVYEVGFYDSGQGTHPFIAMEYIQGVPLLEFLKANTLSIEEKVQLLCQICEGIEYAHSQGVIHLDLKPANILVTKDGQPRILDFGVAKSSDADLQLQTMSTNTSEFIGTLPYMSPEQTRGDTENINASSDVYALGALMYRMLSGKLPHQVKSLPVLDAIKIINEGVPLKLSECNAECAGDLEVIAQKAIEYDRDRRYGSVSALRDDLERFLNHQPILARPQSTGYILSRFVKRHQLLVSSIVAIFIVTIAAAVFSTYKAVEASDARHQTQQRVEQLQKIASSLVFDMTEKVGNIPGATPLREHIAATGIETLKNLESEVEGNDSLALDVGMAWLTLGDILGNPSMANLGRLTEAQEAYERAASLFAQMDTPSLIAFGELNYRKSDLLVASGQTEDALELLGLTLDDLRQEDFPTALEMHITQRIASIQHTLGNTKEAVLALESLVEACAELELALAEERLFLSIKSQLGAMLHVSGQSREATDLLQEALFSITELLEQDPNNQFLLSLKGSVEAELGESFRTLEENELAMEQFNIALETYQLLSGIDPQNLQLKSTLAHLHLRIAELFDGLGMSQEAINEAENAVNLYASIARDGDQQYATRLGMGLSLLHKGTFESKHAQHEEASLSLMSAYSMFTELHEEDKSDTTVLGSLAKTAVQIAENNSKTSGNPKAAGDAMVEYIGLLEMLHEQNPDNVQVGRSLASLYSLIRTQYKNASDFEDALIYNLRNVELAKELSRKDPDDVRIRRSVSVAVGGVGELQAKLSQFEDAKINMDHAVRILNELIVMHPENTQCLRSLSFRLSSIGDMLRQQRLFQESKEYYVNSLAIDQQLIAIQPDNLYWLQDCAISCQRIAESCNMLGEYEEATASFEQAVEYLQVLKTKAPTSAYIERICISTIGRFGEFLYATESFDDALLIAQELVRRCEELIEQHGESPLDLTYLSAMCGLEGRCFSELAAQGDEVQHELHIASATESLNRCISIIEQMVETGSARSYNTALMNDMKVLRTQLQSKKNVE